jgi:hypothetical protein
MDGQALTRTYLAEVERHEQWGLDHAGYETRSPLLRVHEPDEGYLTRPLFLGDEDLSALQADLEQIRLALYALPDQRFGGDRAAFARAVGMTEPQVAAITAAPPGPPTRMMRADLYRDRSGFRLLEVNLGMALGGIAHRDISLMHLREPVLGAFAASHGLGCPDAMTAVADTILTEAGFTKQDDPLIALVDWPDSYESYKPYLEQVAIRFRLLGLRVEPCHIGDLEIREGSVELHGQKVGVVARYFLAEELLEDPALPGALLAAVARGDVKMFAPMETEAFASKGALAMLSEEEHRGLLNPEQRSAVDRLVPWTRRVRPGPVTLEDGSSVDLEDYAVEHREELVLKPTAYSGGAGIVPGWSSEVTADRWRVALDDAFDGTHVIQRRVWPEPELFPGENGQRLAFTVVWGVFTMATGWGGVWVRGTAVESAVDIINFANGAAVGSCLHPV